VPGAIPANNAEPGGGDTVFHPMCGSTPASSRSTVPGQAAQPSVCTACSTPAANSTCMPTQMPSTGRPSSSRRAISLSPPAVRSPDMHAANAPTPGTASPSHSSAASAFAVTSTAAPTRSSARCAERRFPDP